MLYREVEGLVRGWSIVYYASAYAGLAWAVGATILNAIAVFSTFGLVSVPIQYLSVLQDLGWVIDPIADSVFAVMHVAQVMTAVLHTIAYLAWFSYAVAPIVVAIAIPLMVVDKTRASGVALLTLTLTILFTTSIAAKDALITTKLQLMNETVALMNWLSQNAPNASFRGGFLVMNSQYPYLVSGALYGINHTIVGKSVMPIEHPVGEFTAFTGSVTPINTFGVPVIKNATFLWLGIKPSIKCVLLTYIGNESNYEPCDPRYLTSNATYAEVIDFGNPPFNVLTASLNGSIVYTGAWEWLNPPSNYSVLSGNNTAVINFTIDVPPPEHCVNVTEPRAPTHEVCYPGTAGAVLWLFASDVVINMPNSVGNSTKCQYTTSPSNLYKAVNIGGQRMRLRH